MHFGTEQNVGPKPPDGPFRNGSFVGGCSVIGAVLAYANTGSHRARAQSALADGARARNRTRRVHGINATSVTAHKPPFPDSRIMLLISVSLSITKFLPEQRVDQDGMIQLLDRSSTSTSTSTKNSQNKTMHRSGRSAALNFRNHFGGHSVMVAVRNGHNDEQHKDEQDYGRELRVCESLCSIASHSGLSTGRGGRVAPNLHQRGSNCRQ